MSKVPTVANDLASTVNGSIRAEAARRGIRLVDVAEAAGFSSVALHRRLTGSVSWNLAELEAVADLLGVTVVDLIGAAA